MSESDVDIRATNRLHRIRELETQVKAARKDLEKVKCWENGHALSWLTQERNRLVAEARSAVRVVVDNSELLDLVG